jgi:Protein of unknown function (DUF1580)
VIDTTLEQPLPVAVLAREVTNREGRRGVNVSTFWRWMLRGVKGVRLESIMVGGIRMSSREALARFFIATTAAANGESAPAVTTIQRQRQIEQAERELAKAGI